MSFAKGFEKTAVILPALQAARGTVSKAVGGATKVVKDFAAGQKAKGISSYREAVRPSAVSNGAARKSPGTALYNSRIEKATNAGKRPGSIGEHEAVAAGAKKDVYARKEKMDASAAKNKKSFASKHPLMTAGALYLGTKAALGGGDKDKQQPQQPQFVPPQQ